MRKREISNDNNDLIIKVGENGKSDYIDKLKIVGDFFDKIMNAKWNKIIKTFMVVLLFAFLGIFTFFAYNVAKNKKNIELIVDNMVNKYIDEELDGAIRDEITPIVNDNIQKMVYKLHADRVCIFEMHNGKKNDTNLPFKYADMTYERIDNDNLELRYIADSYKDMSLSLYTLPFYVEKNTYFNGTIDDVKLIDNKFAMFMKKEGGTYLISVVFRSHYTGKPIGFLCAFYDNGNMPLSSDGDEELKEMKDDVKELSGLLDLHAQKEKRINDGAIKKDTEI